MVQMQIVEKPAFWVAGVRRFVSSAEDFGALWAQCHKDGTVDGLKALGGTGPVTGSRIFGVSCVTDLPAPDAVERSFDFVIATEVAPDQEIPAHLARLMIPAATWAVFSGEGTMLEALYAAEMYAFGTFLPEGKYRHAMLPELEVYPVSGSPEVTFWLSVVPA